MGAHASDTVARKLIKNGEQNHKLNFPDNGTVIIKSKSFEKATSSQYIGVSYNESKSAWRAYRWRKNEKKMVYNGFYKDEETAAHASDTLAREFMANGGQKLKVNFPDDETEVYAETV